MINSTFGIVAWLHFQNNARTYIKLIHTSVTPLQIHLDISNQHFHQEDTFFLSLYYIYREKQNLDIFTCLQIIIEHDNFSTKQC